jgi:competence protein ComEC
VALALLAVPILAGGVSLNGRGAYESRWRWGTAYAALTVLLAMAVTMMAERREVRLATENGREKGVIAEIAAQSQWRLVEKIDKLSLTDTEKAVLAALTTGYKKALPRDVRKRFAVSGVAHILAVSGFHVAVVYGFVSFLLGWLLPKRFSLRILRCVLTVGAVWVFVQVSGMAVSSIRAGCMLTVYLIGKYLAGRRVDNYNNLAATAFAMLAYNPFFLFDIGFQLSFTAVFFILYLQPPLNRLIDVRNPLLAKPWGWVTVSVAAQVGTAFLCSYYFGYFSLTFLFTNVPVMLYASVLIPAALVWLLLPAGGAMLQCVVEKLTHYLVDTVDLFGSFPEAAYPFRFSLAGVIAGYTAMGAAFFAAASWKRRKRQLIQGG